LQLAALSKDYSGVADVDSRVKALSSSAIVDPRVLGVVREAFGSKSMAAGDWHAAYRDFYDAFSAYQQAGSPRAVQCLRYTLLANMVANMSVDPFDSPEAKAFQRDPLIASFVQLRQAFENDDMARFDATLRDPASHILDDPTMVEHLEPLFRNFRSRIILRRVKPYRSVRLEFLASELKISSSQVEDLLVALILDGKLHGTLDQVAGVLVLTASGSSTQEKTYAALSATTSSLRRVHATVLTKLVSG
jgi:COP9 signalosome complex subunit 2